jgi:hypothetical protein
MLTRNQRRGQQELRLLPRRRVIRRFSSIGQASFFEAEMCPALAELTPSVTGVSSIHAAADPLPVGTRSQAEAVPRPEYHKTYFHTLECRREPWF